MQRVYHVFYPASWNKRGESLTDDHLNVQEFWNKQAMLAEYAGTKDLMAKQLEIVALSKYIKSGQKILEIGCGNGITAVELARRFKIDIKGIDFSEKMISEARKIAYENQLIGQITFEVGDVLDLSNEMTRYDLIFTERVLINLPDWQAQSMAIKDIIALLNPGGKYLMCENSQDGLDRINMYRESCGLNKINPPWHNRYLKEEEINHLKIQGAKLMGVEHYSSTYYFISRVVNAWLAAQDGIEPQYDATVNQLGLLLPPMGDFGQGKLWIWEK